MNIHTEIVSVTYRRGCSGERQQWDFHDWQINRPDPDEWPEDLAGYDWNGQPTPTAYMFIDLPTDWFGLRFEFFGQWFDDRQSALSWEVYDGGANEVFGKWTDELKAIADKMLDDETERRRTDFNYRLNSDEPPRQVTFLTAWKYRCGEDYEGEFWSKWELLGRIDMSKIETLIVPAAQEVAA